VGTCQRCGGPDERDCYCEQVARAIVCGPGRLVGALGNHWGDDDLQGGSCTHVCNPAVGHARLTPLSRLRSAETSHVVWVSAEASVRLSSAPSQVQG
jgi:hypothetical protein